MMIWKKKNELKRKTKVLYVAVKSKNSRFIKKQEVRGLLVGDNSPFKWIPIIGSILWRYTINETVKSFLFAWDKFMAETHLRQLKFINSVCEPLTENKEIKPKFRETGN